MSRIYEFEQHTDVLLDAVLEGRVPGVSHVKQDSPYWPNGVSDGEALGSLEGNLMLFWGLSDEASLLLKLKQAGFPSRYIG